MTSLKEGLKDIYYITGESMKLVENSPFLECLKKKKYDVLYMVDAIDEYVVGQLKEYDDLKLFVNNLELPANISRRSVEV
ncbi:Heat shock protein 82 [Capsicum chinense]|nr:Heat shock protein 82 [Capsicum chinense]